MVIYYVGYFEKLLTQTLDNLQIFVDNIHVRVEGIRISVLYQSCNNVDTVKKQAIAAGVTLSHLHVQSANEHWEATYLTVGNDTMYKVQLSDSPAFQKTNSKLLDLTNLSAYIDCRPKLFQYDSLKEFSVIMKKMIGRKNHQAHVIAPISAHLRVFQPLARCQDRITSTHSH